MMNLIKLIQEDRRLVQALITPFYSNTVVTVMLLLLLHFTSH